MASYFSKEELSCTCCQSYKFDDTFLTILNNIRKECGFPFIVTSAYRCEKHPIEARKRSPGEHTTGKAIDIAVTGEKALQLIRVAQDYGITRIGVQQKGSGRFIHLGYSEDFPSPSIWSY